MAQEARAMKATTSRQDDPVMTRAHSARFWAATSTGSAPPRPDDAPDAPPAQVQPMAGQDCGDPLLRDVWKQAAVAVAWWLILLGLTLLTLSTVAQQAPPAPPAAPVRSKVIAPGFSGNQPQQPGPGRETKR
jgi:hypothetical protein